MNSNNAPRASVPYDQAMQPLLQDPYFVAHYLLDAVADEPQAPGSLIAALEDIIRANASAAHGMKAFSSIAVMMHHLSSEQLLGLVDFMEEIFPPELRSFYADHGTFQGMRKVAAFIAAEGPIILDSTEHTSNPPPQGISQAEAAIQQALPDITGSEPYHLMHQAVTAA